MSKKKKKKCITNSIDKLNDFLRVTDIYIDIKQGTN